LSAPQGIALGHRPDAQRAQLSPLYSITSCLFADLATDDIAEQFPTLAELKLLDRSEINCAGAPVVDHE